MTCDHQLFMLQAADAAGGVVAGKNSFSKSSLVYANLHDGTACSAFFYC